MPDVDRNQPALIGGLIVGVLSILPIAQAANICCCLWALVGGATAVKLYINRSSTPVSWAEAARVAALAGVLGAIIRVFLGTPLDLATFPAQIVAMEKFAEGMADPLRQQLLETLSQLRQLPSGQLVVRFLLPISLFWAVILFVFTEIGGLLGVVLFEKRRGQTPTAPGGFDEGANP
jgi:hypothetical protein